jgi:hypothetical protein
MSRALDIINRIEEAAKVVEITDIASLKKAKDDLGSSRNHVIWKYKGEVVLDRQQSNPIKILDGHAKMMNDLFPHGITPKGWNY